MFVIIFFNFNSFREIMAFFHRSRHLILHGGGWCGALEHNSLSFVDRSYATDLHLDERFKCSAPPTLGHLLREREWMIILSLTNEIVVVRNIIGAICVTSRVTRTPIGRLVCTQARIIWVRQNCRSCHSCNCLTRLDLSFFICILRILPLSTT